MAGNPTDWARAIGTTIVNYLREEEQTTFRKFKVFAALESSGNVVMNQAGLGLNWQVRYRNLPKSEQYLQKDQPVWQKPYLLC